MLTSIINGVALNYPLIYPIIRQKSVFNVNTLGDRYLIAVYGKVNFFAFFAILAEQKGKIFR